MKTRVLILEEYSTVPGYFRLAVSWGVGRKQSTVTSAVIGPNSLPEAVAEELRSLGYAILKARADARGVV
jgi:hypothetical protein